MITIFNRREVALTQSLDRLDAVRRALEGGGVRYVTRSEGFASAGRGRGMPGWQPETAATYRVYVHRADFEKALYLLGRAT